MSPIRKQVKELNLKGEEAAFLDNLRAYSDDAKNINYSLIDIASKVPMSTWGTRTSIAAPKVFGYQGDVDVLYCSSSKSSEGGYDL